MQRQTSTKARNEVKPELKADIEKALKTLRQADSQAAAVAWMTNAYKLLEACLEAQDEQRFVFAPEPLSLVVSQAAPKHISQKRQGLFAANRRAELQQASLSQTVVYPSIYLPPGLKPLPKPWTREDTRRLERAAANRVQSVQRFGK